MSAHAGNEADRSDDPDDDDDGHGHSCATGAAHRVDTTRPPHPVDLAVRWRRYQELAIARLLRADHSGDRRLQLVAPPGSGKTLMGLFVALALGRPIVVLANTRVIAAQWLEALREHAVDIEGRHAHEGGPAAGASGGIAGWLDARVCDALPGSDQRMPMLVATTYQAFTRQRPQGLVRGANVADRLAPTLAAVHRRYGAAGVLLVLDECHHLQAWWGEALGALLDEHPDVAVLGLTATPPQDAGAQERRVFDRLVGEVTVEIPLVGAVREGALAPFQDLAHFVRPETAATQAILGVDAAWSAWLRDARDSYHAADAPGWLPGLLHHARQRTTIRPGRRERDVTDVLALFDREADFAIAVARFLVAEGEDLPADVYPHPEMARPPTRADMLALVDDYVYCVLSVSPDDPQPDATLQREIERRRDSLSAALKPFGWRLRRRGVQTDGDDGDVGDWLAASRTRIVGMVDVLRHEWRQLGVDLCAAVISDFVRTAAGGVGGRVDDDDGYVPGAIGAWRAIAADPELSALLPMLVTGEEKWLHASLLDPLAERLGAHAVGLHSEALSASVVGGAQGAWMRVRLPGHDGVLLGALTGLLERDAAHCIVGTRMLLGEGWNCKALDTLIDLTSARSHVAVNQLRGRALRLDADRPHKVAHLWDIVAVPAVAAGSSVGLVDVERFLRKHQRFYAPARDGALELGAGHVDPRLRGSATAFVGDIEVIGQTLWQLAEDRGEARRRWRLGEVVGEDELLEVSLMVPEPSLAPSLEPSPRSAARGPMHLDAQRLCGPHSDEGEQRWRRRVQQRPRVWIGYVVAVITAAVALSAIAAGLSDSASATGSGTGSVRLGGALLAVAGIGAGWLHLWWRREARALDRLLAGLADADVEAAIVRVVIAAAAGAGKRVAAVRIAAGRAPDAGRGPASLCLRGSDATGRARVALALEQALGGCPAPHHALEVAGVRPQRPGLFSDPGGAFEPLGTVPVPSALGTSRKMAEAYAAAWRKHIGPCTLVALRTERVHDDVPLRPPSQLRWLQVSQCRVQQRQLLQG